MPSSVTPTYLHTVLGVSERTAQEKELVTLRRLGLLSPENTPTDLAKRWRDDGEYPAVCAEILKNIYPQELLQAVPDPSKEMNEAVRWFMNSTGVGVDAAFAMARTYRLLVEADPSSAADVKEKKSRSTHKRIAKAQKNKDEVLDTGSNGTSQTHASIEGVKTDSQAPTTKRSYSSSPSIHIDVQIHISADASPAQIDHIFASMAKHLYKHDES